MSAIDITGLDKSFGVTPVLRDVDLVVAERSITAILGTSGSGKTTLLRIIAGIERADRGMVRIGGSVVDDGRRSVPAQHRGVGYVPQDGALFPHLTVAGNIAFGLARRHRSKVAELIDLAGLAGLDRRYPNQLSGGQQQRVALARALAVEPKVVLLDEPFSSLDATLRNNLRRDVARVLNATGTTTVIVTHDQDEALSLADQIAVLRHGRVVACEDPRELYANPPDAEAATFIGEANMLAADLGAGGARTALGVVAVHGQDPPAGHGPYRILLRPEQLVVDTVPDAASTPATVVEFQYHGHDSLAYLRVDGDDGEALLARVDGHGELRPGQKVGVRVEGSGRVWAADPTSAAATSAE